MSSQQLTPRVTAAGSAIGRASGFELTSPGQPGAANLEAALERKRAFAGAGGHHGAVVFPNLRLFVITCLDPRVDPAHFLDLGLSDAMVVRNVGGRVTPEAINDVAFIGQLAENVLPDGPLFEVAVIHHTQCGTGALADDTFRRRYAERIGAEEFDPDRARRPRPGGDRHPRRRAPALRTRDLPARHRVRARLRRRHGPSADGHPGLQLSRSNR
jgi:carbonic anhydrase